MAKGKHATALFEVIHSAKTSSNGRNNAGLLRTPKWWFKGREKNGASSAPPPATSAPAPTAEMMPAFEPTPSEPARPTAPPINLGVDPDKQQITFKLTYSGTIIASFAIVVIVSLAYIIGRHGTGVASANASVSTEQIRNGPIHRDVLNVSPVSGAVGISSPNGSNATNESEGYTAPPAKTNGGQASASHLSTETPKPAVTAGGKVQRIIGMQYVIVQSYPDDPDAQEAVKLLKENGIDASVENISWYSKWPCVVGATPFDRLKNNPQYDHYIQQIESVSRKFAGRSKFKQFAPAPIRWK
jgi:hypothetical protein